MTDNKNKDDAEADLRKGVSNIVIFILTFLGAVILLYAFIMVYRTIKDNLDILDFTLTDEEMAEIAKLDKNVRYYHRTEEQLKQFAAWKPQFERA